MEFVGRTQERRKVVSTLVEEINVYDRRLEREDLTKESWKKGGFGSIERFYFYRVKMSGRTLKSYTRKYECLISDWRNNVLMFSRIGRPGLEQGELRGHVRTEVTVTCNRREVYLDVT